MDAATFMDLDKVRPKTLDGAQLGDSALLQLLDSRAYGVWLLRIPDGELFWSPRLAEAFGYDLKVDHEVPSLIELTHPDDRARHEETVTLSMQTGNDYEIEIRMRNRLGDYLSLHAHGCWLRDDNGQANALVGFVQDVSDSAQMRIALKRSEDRFRAFFDQAPAAVYIKDKDSRHLYGNAVAAAFAGTDLEHFLGATAFDVFTPEVAASLDAVDKRVLDEGKTIVYTGPVESPGGKLRHTYDVKFPVEDTTTGERLVGGFAIDVTELTLIKERLEDAQRLESVGLLASGIAHDFNNLIFAISGNAELAMKNVDGEGRELLSAILQATDHATALCSQLLAVGGKAESSKERIDVNSILRESRELFEMTLQSHCSLAFETTRETNKVRVDASLLRQILVNLILNAMQASERDSVITVGSYNLSLGDTGKIPDFQHSWLPDNVEDLVCVYVDDSGSGIQPEVLSRVVEPYFTGKEQGHGLGLAAVAGILMTSEGALQIESEAGRGTRFSCFFQAAPEPETQQDEQPAESAARQFTSAIIIDDNEAILDITANMLGRLGIHVDAFRSGLPAMKRLTSGAPVDFVISDISMPEIGGMALLKKIRAHDPSLPVILASGYHDNAMTFDDDDRTWFLQKPWSLADLQRLLDEMSST